MSKRNTNSVRETPHIHYKGPGTSEGTADIGTRPVRDDSAATNAVIAATAAAGGVPGSIVAAGVKTPSGNKKPR